MYLTLADPSVRGLAVVSTYCTGGTMFHIITTPIRRSSVDDLVHDSYFLLLYGVITLGGI